MGFRLEHIGPGPEKGPNTDRLDALLKREVNFFGGRLLNNKRKEELYMELSVLLRAGINLKECLSLIAENQKKPRLKAVYHEMVAALVSGKGFYEILRDNREFSEYEYYSVQIGEETGTLSRIVEELGNFYERKNEQRRALVNALTYPLVILVTAVLVVVFMLRMVVPMFEDIFRQNNVDLPAVTKMVVSVSNLIRDYGWGAILLGALLIVLWRSLAKKIWFKRRRDLLLFGMPYVGPFVGAVYLAQFAQAVALLTTSKVPMLNSIRLVDRMIDFYPLNRALSKVEQGVLSGKSLYASMGGSKIFDNRMISLVRVAEETNRTEYIFERLNQQYATEVRQRSKMLSTLLEPLIIVLVGIFVGIILISMYLPMFRLSTVLG